MYIQEALKETGKAKCGGNNGCASWQEGYTWYAKRDGTFLRWFDQDGNPRCEITYFDIINHTDWLPYHPVEQIVPKEAGELWALNKYVYHHTVSNGYGKITMVCYSNSKDTSEVIHNQNGWTRIHPPVKEDS
jgi:hypothetical protein